MNRFWKYSLALVFAVTFAKSSFSQSLPLPPAGRLTLQSNTPVMTTDVVGATTVYWTPYQGSTVPIYTTSGSTWDDYYNIPQETLTLSPSVEIAGKIYDVFMFHAVTGETLGVGPAWASSTTRGTGASTTQITLLDGIWVNANYIALYNGTGYQDVTANQATYLGSIYMTGNGETSAQFTPAAAIGGSATVIGLWNAYNRVPVTASSADSTSSWSYSSGTWRNANGSTNNSITWLDGLGQTSISAAYDATGSNSSATGSTNVTVFINNLTTPSINAQVSLTTSLQSMHSTTLSPPLFGLNSAQAWERVPSGTETFYSGNLNLLTLHTEY